MGVGMMFSLDALSTSSKMCSGMAERSPKNVSVIPTSGTVHGLLSLRYLEWLCMLQNHKGSLVTGCLLMGVSGSSMACRRYPSLAPSAPHTISKSMSNLGATVSPIALARSSFALGTSTSLSNSPNSPLSWIIGLKKSKFDTEILIFLSYSSCRTSVSMSLRMRLPSATKKSPPPSVAGMKHTNAPNAAVLFVVDSLCSPM
mmetsp:Transcript_9209/g.17182  ORF Transcript_9209/g.17182 Transcript_9209/m.17182 type:complete len:201 (-) Transcript_9209:1464-2066(-)